MVSFSSISDHPMLCFGRAIKNPQIEFIPRPFLPHTQFAFDGFAGS